MISHLRIEVQRLGEPHPGHELNIEIISDEEKLTKREYFAETAFEFFFELIWKKIGEEILSKLKEKEATPKTGQRSPKA